MADQGNDHRQLQVLPAGVCIVMMPVNLQSAGCLRAGGEKAASPWRWGAADWKKSNLKTPAAGERCYCAVSGWDSPKRRVWWTDDSCEGILCRDKRRFVMTLISCSSNLESLWVSETTIWVATTAFIFALLIFYLNQLRSGRIWNSN